MNHMLSMYVPQGTGQFLSHSQQLLLCGPPACLMKLMRQLSCAQLQYEQIFCIVLPWSAWQ